VLHPRPTLGSALALAEAAVDGGVGIPTADDPLRLDLPSLVRDSSVLPSADAVRLLGTLYFAAELEQAGVVPIVELLAAERDTLDLRSYESAERLDRFVSSEHGWYDHPGRASLYARLFGVGPAATNEAGTLVNREFQSLLASLCHALARCATDPAGSVVATAGLEQAASSLLANLASRSLGNTQLAARRLVAQASAAVTILRDPAVEALVGAHSLQATIVAILGSDAPDVQRLIDLGTAGQQVLTWLATTLPAVGGGGTIAVGPGDTAIAAAAHWLNAAGIDAPAVQVAA
jgi:hypothetical protein